MITESDLYRRLKIEIDKIPAIDTHVHIKPAAPLAKNLAQILYYLNYVSELIAGGAPDSFHDNETLDPISRVKAFVPEMEKSSCSVHAWMLRELLRTVYGFDEKLTENNWKKLYETVDRKSHEPGRVKEVCKLAGVEKVFIHLPAVPVAQSGLDQSIFVGLSDLEIPVVPGAKGIAALEQQTGASISSADDMFNAAVEYLQRGAACGQRGVRIGISPALRLSRPGRAAVERSFDRLIMGKNCQDEDRVIVETFALDAVLAGAAATGMVVQVFVEGSFLGEERIPSAEQSLAASLHGLV
ncbi:MAG: hypothetical protein WCS27_18505, partial [Victivallaceae bacterium]